MANEITVSASLQFAKGSSTDKLTFAGAFTMSGTKFIRNRQSIGITEEALDIGDLTNEGWMLMINRDTTNFVSLRQGQVATYVLALVRINAGEGSLFRVHAGATLWATADTASCDVEYLLIEA